MKQHLMRTSWHKPLLLLLLVMAPGVTNAADWVERPFDPAIGSRWFVATEATKEDSHQGANQTTQTNSRYEITWEAKTDDGYRMSAVARDVSVTGNTPMAALMDSALGSVKGIVIRATTNRSGRPIRIENLDEVRQTMTAVIDKIITSTQGTPEVGQMVRNLIAPMLNVDGEHAATLYLEELAMLSLAQNTGMKPGEERRETLESANPFGGSPVMSNVTMVIVNADAATGNVTYRQSQTFDPEVVRALMENVVRQTLEAAAKLPGSKVPPNAEDIVMQMMKQATMSMGTQTEFDVTGGMTRAAAASHGFDRLCGGDVRRGGHGSRRRDGAAARRRRDGPARYRP